LTIFSPLSTFSPFRHLSIGGSFGDFAHIRFLFQGPSPSTSQPSGFSEGFFAACGSLPFSCCFPHNDQANPVPEHEFYGTDPLFSAFIWLLASMFLVATATPSSHQHYYPLPNLCYFGSFFLVFPGSFSFVLTWIQQKTPQCLFTEPFLCRSRITCKLREQWWLTLIPSHNRTIVRCPQVLLTPRSWCGVNTIQEFRHAPFVV